MDVVRSMNITRKIIAINQLCQYNKISFILYLFAFACKVNSKSNAHILDCK